MPKPLTPSKKLRKKQLLSNKHVRSGRRKTLRELEQASKLIGSETGSGKKKDLVWGLVQNKKFAAVAAILGSAVAIPFVIWYYTKGNEKTVPELAKLTGTSLQEAKKLKDLLPNPVGKVTLSDTLKDTAKEKKKTAKLTETSLHVVIQAGTVTLHNGDIFETSENTYIIQIKDTKYYRIAVPTDLINWLVKKKYSFQLGNTTETHAILSTCPFWVTQIKEYMPKKGSIFMENFNSRAKVYRIDVEKNISLHYLILDGDNYALLHTHFVKDDQIETLKKTLDKYTMSTHYLPDEYIVFNMKPSELYKTICKDSKLRNVINQAMKETNLCQFWGLDIYMSL